MAVLSRRGLHIPIAPIAGVTVFGAILLAGLLVWRQELPAAETGWFTRPVAIVAVFPAIIVGYLVGVTVRGSTEGLRILVSVTGGVAAAGLGLLLAGLAEPGQSFPADLAWPGSNIGRAGMWLMAAALGPVVAAWAIEYRRSDPWYVLPVALAILVWGAPLVGAALLLRETIA